MWRSPRSWIPGPIQINRSAIVTTSPIVSRRRRTPRIHYWWFNSRDYKPGDEAIDTFLYEASSQAYYEDIEALEWIMDVVRNDAEPQIDLSFAPDKPGLMARRIMYRLAMKEVR